MSESVSYKFDFFDFQQDNFIVRQPVFTIDDLAEAGLPDGARRELEESGARLRAVVTGADGACGMHAAFGHPFTSQELVKRNARSLASQLLGEDPESLVTRGAHIDNVQAITNNIWNELALPNIHGTPSPEGEIFWSALEEESPDLICASEDHVQAYNDNLDMCDFLKGELAVAARAFFHLVLEACMIRPAAVALGYIPAEVDVLSLLSSVGHEDLMIHAEQYHFLQSAATRSSSSGELVVRGSCGALFPNNGPLIK